MWTVIAIVSILVGVTVLVWRLVVINRRAPDENDRDRQHEVPGADQPPPPRV